MIALIILMTVLIIALGVAQIYAIRLLRRLCRLAEMPDEEIPRDKEKESYERQWNALMTYGGDVNGETKRNGDE